MGDVVLSLFSDNTSKIKKYRANKRNNQKSKSKIQENYMK